MCFHVQDMTLTYTGVDSHSPGEGANLPSILGPPQALQLGKFTGCADKCAQALKGDLEVRLDTDLGLQCFCRFVYHYPGNSNHFKKFQTLSVARLKKKPLQLLAERAAAEPWNTALTYLYAKCLQTHSSH